MSSQFFDEYFKNPSLYAGFPALLPPAGEQIDFENPESRGPLLVILGAVFLGLMMIFVIIRVYTKTWIIRKSSWDDYTCALATVRHKSKEEVTGADNRVRSGRLPSTGFRFGVIFRHIDEAAEMSTDSPPGVSQGAIGKHQWNVKLGQMITDNYAIQAFLTMVLVNPILLLAKLSFFLLYLDLFRPMRWLRICSYLGAAFTILLYTSCTVAQIVVASPRPSESWTEHYFINPLSLKGVQVGVPLSALGLVLDLYIFVLPISVVFKLQIPMARKLGVALVFMTGLLACIASALSLYYRVLLTRTDDFQWVLAPIILAGLLEINVGVICACMPSMHHTLRHHLPPFNALKSRLSSSLRLLSPSLKVGKSQSSHRTQTSKDGGQYVADRDYHCTRDKRYVALETTFSTEAKLEEGTTRESTVKGYAWGERTPAR
ncbi:hypothetical protein GJ744_006147 [Endocarpon pusillum]|uniref:Rhodopsin domain-containing protein n=1 Tax=Endocarpon pusillum TaxID=364733 RepID=A0A8H7A6L0_9EURO|nr:hypothetical protein GJ744_006147 [Endocarpon pusillum]